MCNLKHFVVLFVLHPVRDHQAHKEKLGNSGLVYQLVFSTIFPFKSSETHQQHLCFCNSVSWSPLHPALHPVPCSAWFPRGLSWTCTGNHRPTLVAEHGLVFCCCFCVCKFLFKGRFFPMELMCQACAGHSHLAHIPARPALAAHCPRDAPDNQNQPPGGGQQASGVPLHFIDWGPRKNLFRSLAPLTNQLSPFNDQLESNESAFQFSMFLPRQNCCPDTPVPQNTRIFRFHKV